MTKELVKTEKSRLMTPEKRLFSPLEEMEKWLEDVWTRPFSLFRAPFLGGLTEMREISPSVDIYEEGNELVFKADVPGVKKEDLTVNIHDNFLIISGEKKREEKIERDNYYRYERSHGSFHRRFELPEGLDTEKVKAHFENGVLEVKIPKSEEAERKIKKISIE